MRTGVRNGIGRIAYAVSAPTACPMSTMEEFTLLLDVRQALASRFADTINVHAGCINITLPWPLSVNHVWKTLGRRVVLDKDVRHYRESVLGKASWMRHQKIIPSKPLLCDCAVMIEYNPPDKRRRDIDNFAKVVLDAITYSKIWKDDSQVVVLLSYFGEPVKYGAVNVTICPLEV